MDKKDYILLAGDYLEKLSRTIIKGENISYKFGLYDGSTDNLVEVYFDVITCRWSMNSKITFKRVLLVSLTDDQLSDLARQLRDVLKDHMKSFVDMFNKEYIKVIDSYSDVGCIARFGKLRLLDGGKN